MLLTERLKTPSVIIPATIVTIAAMMLLPLLVHSLPVQGAPMGARLLPIFFAPLVAIYLVHPAVALIASLVTPYLNHVLIGNPPQPLMLTLTSELVIFSLICWGLKRFKLRFVAPFAYVVAKTLTLIFYKTTQLTSTAPWNNYLPSLQLALPGLVLLLVINLALQKVDAKTQGQLTR
ncbi:MAG: hypothetical protein AAF267_00815 [Deinococcota bacterium]